MSTQLKPLSAKEKTSLVIASIGIIVLAAVVAMVLIKTKPKSQRKPHITGAPLVEVQALVSMTHQVEIPVLGTLVPSVDYTLQSRVSGELLWRSPAFVEGSRVTSGDTLLIIDPSDFELALENASAQRELAQVGLLTERGRQQIAQREWELLAEDSLQVSAESRDLVRRLPQLRSAEATLRGAEAAVKLARLNVSRCVIQSSTDAIVLAALVNPGDQISPLIPLGRMAGSNSWWLRASLPMEELQWIDFPREELAGSSVQITSTTGAILEGRVLQLEAELEKGGRLARILIEIPSALDQANDQHSSILLGEVLRAVIQGRMLESVNRIDRTQMREGSTLWLVDQDNRLHIRPANPIWMGEQDLIIPRLPEQLRLVSSALGSAFEGMEVRVAGDPQTAEPTLKQGTH